MAKRRRRTSGNDFLPAVVAAPPHGVGPSERAVVVPREPALTVGAIWTPPLGPVMVCPVCYSEFRLQTNFDAHVARHRRKGDE